MLATKRKTALAAVPAAALITGAVITLSGWGGWPSSTSAASPAPKPCVSAVLPDAYYQAVAELNACTGMNVAVEVPPGDAPWAIAGELPSPGSDGRLIVDP